jgi:hypothetical protein
MTTDADELLKLRRRLSLARLLIQLHAPAGAERREAIAAIDELLPLLTDAELVPAVASPPAMAAGFG